MSIISADDERLTPSPDSRLMDADLYRPHPEPPRLQALRMLIVAADRPTHPALLRVIGNPAC